MYKNWPIRSDLALLRNYKIQPNVLTRETQLKADALLAELKRLQEQHKGHKRQSSYNLIYEKAQIFTKSATEEEVKELIAIGEKLFKKF